MAKLLVTALARTDLTNIWLYIASDNPESADKLLTQINDGFKLIAASPSLGFTLDEIRPGVRCKPVTRNYLIFYEVVTETVRISQNAARRQSS